jgi:hypothetical protein
MWVGTLLAFGTMLAVLLFTAPDQVPSQLDSFSTSIGGSSDWYAQATAATIAAGVDLTPPFSLLATLLIAPIAWTSLQWATYSSQQNGEIKDARSFRSQAFIIIGALVVTGLLLALLAFGLERAVGSQFLTWRGPATGRASPKRRWVLLAVAEHHRHSPGLRSSPLSSAPASSQQPPDRPQLLHRHDR